MNPFIVDGSKDGRYVLPLQIQNCSSGCNFSELIRSKKVCELLLPQGHSFDASWACILNFENQIFFTLSAASTGVGGWMEAGSLNICISTSIDWDCAPWGAAKRFPICDFRISSIFKMVVDRPEFYSECGLQLISEQGAVFRVATGVAPSSMSIELPQNGSLFMPEFSIDEYRLVGL